MTDNDTYPKDVVSSHNADSGRVIKLTRLGEIARQHGVMTPGAWYQKILKEVNREADRGGDWELLLEERILGLAAILSDARHLGLDSLTLLPNGSSGAVDDG